MRNLLILSLFLLILLNIGCGVDGERNTQIKPERESLPTQTVPNSNVQPVNAPANMSTGVKYDLTMEKFNSLKDGMSYEEAVKVIGGEGFKMPEAEGDKDKGVTYKWEGENYTTIFATFKNNKLTYKTNIGLK